MNQSHFTQTQTDVTPSDSMKIVLMMYDGSINFLNKAIEYAEKGDVKNRNIYANKANDIIVELDNAVNNEAGGELSKNLKWLYSFMNRHLIAAVQKNETQGLTDVVGMLSDLRGSWQYVNKWRQNGLENNQKMFRAMAQ
jgi:flagellar protein FliS